MEAANFTFDRPALPCKRIGSVSISGTPSGKSGVDMSNPIHPLATLLGVIVSMVVEVDTPVMYSVVGDRSTGLECGNCSATCQFYNTR